jgi:hypothetical protein
MRPPLLHANGAKAGQSPDGPKGSDAIPGTIDLGTIDFAAKFTGGVIEALL